MRWSEDRTYLGRHRWLQLRQRRPTIPGKYCPDLTTTAVLPVLLTRRVYSVPCGSMLPDSSPNGGVRVVGLFRAVGDRVLSEFMSARDALARLRLLKARELPSIAQPTRATEFGTGGVWTIEGVGCVGSVLWRWWMRSRRRREAPGGLLVVHTRHVDPQSESGNWFHERSLSPICRLEEYLFLVRISGGLGVQRLAHRAYPPERAIGLTEVVASRTLHLTLVSPSTS